MADLNTLTIAEARKGLDAKTFSARELTDACLKAIAAKDTDIHAYLEVWEKEARAEADRADAMIAKGESKALTGIPLAIKDNILIKGRIASSASKILEHYVASYDATVTQKLKAQGAVFLGRTNMDEFALGSSTENSAYGPTKNPHDTSRIPGGTSGGSAAAVAADMAIAALGSDTGGSIRYPSAMCGTVGLKPSYGAVSRFGLMAAASSLDQIGAIGKTVADAKALFGAIQGHDANDSTSRTFEVPTRNRKRIGVPRAFVEKGMDADMLASFEKTLKRLTNAGYSVVDIDIPSLAHSLSVYYIINPAEVSTNLARYDGIRYGLSMPADSIGEVYTKTRAAGFGPETRRRVLVGTFVLSAGYADAYYRKARAVRELMRSEFAAAYEDLDAIAMPVSPVPAFKFGEKSDPLALYAVDVFTVSVNLVGVPAMSIPSDSVTRDGVRLPVGFQLLADHGAEETLFAIGADVERLREGM